MVVPAAWVSRMMRREVRAEARQRGGREFRGERRKERMLRALQWARVAMLERRDSFKGSMSWRVGREAGRMVSRREVRVSVERWSW